LGKLALGGQLRTRREAAFGCALQDEFANS
jgi:hypothetical protein